MMTNSMLFFQVLILIISQTTAATSLHNLDGLVSKPWKSSMDLLGKLLLTSKHDKMFGKASLLMENNEHEELLQIMQTVLNLARNGSRPTSGEQQSVLSKDCTKSFDDMADDILAHKNYKKILQLLDADGKPGSGVYQGNLLWLGSYQECQATPDSHYCLSQLNVSPSVGIFLGLCMPKKCSENDTFTVLKTVASIIDGISHNIIKIKISRNSTFAKTYGSPVICHKAPSYSTGNIAAFCVTGFLLLLVLTGTLFDYMESCMATKESKLHKSNGFMPVEANSCGAEAYLPVNDSQPLLSQSEVKKTHGNLCAEILLCFSLRKNVKSILDTDVPSGAITCLNGIRTLSMFWVILGHTFFFSIYSGSDNIVAGFKVVHRFAFQAIANAYFSVDTFFLLSGLLVSYLCLKRFDKYTGYSFLRYFGAKFLPQFYLHRFLRLTPSYMYVILFYIFIFPFCGEGPLWFEKSQGPTIDSCRKYWWTNLLYINNFYPTDMGQECIGWSWYLANDMQFYLVSPLILFIMYKLRLPGTLIVNTAICVISFIITGTIIYTNNLSALLTGDFQAVGAGTQAQHFADWIYSKPYCRIPPYIVGLTLGYLIYHRKEPRGNTKTIIAILGWTTATAVALAATYGPYTSFKQDGRPFTLAENVLYGTFSRFSWGMCVAWVIYACTFRMGGIVNTILSWKAFIPMSRLTYSAYLIHPIVIYVFYSSLEKPFHYSDISIVFYYASFLLLTYSAAFVLSVCVEFPASNLEKLTFRF